MKQPLMRIRNSETQGMKVVMTRRTKNKETPLHVTLRKLYTNYKAMRITAVPHLTLVEMLLEVVNNVDIKLALTRRGWL